MSHSLRKLRNVANIGLMALVVVGAAACGGGTTSYDKAVPAPAGYESTPHTSAPPDDASTSEEALKSDGDNSGIILSAPTGTSAGARTSGAVAQEALPPGGSDTVHPDTLPAPNYQSPLTAGQVDDNSKFSDYLSYLQQYSGEPVHPVDVSKRLFVRVVDSSQQPVAGARVQLYDGQTAVFDGRTVSDGRALFFPSATSDVQAQRYHAVVSRGKVSVEGDIQSGVPEATVALSTLADNKGPVALDLVFLLDATGSMDDEISQIKATVGSIAERIEQLPGSSAPRFGLVAFRDRGDDYITRQWDFTSDTNLFSANLENVEAGGGGDNPESVSAGLHDAINLPGWSSDESGKHLRMIVLVGDAPPHLDYPNDYEYTTLLQDAVQRGIKVFPIGASGLNAQGEYIFRQFAEITQGQFIFLTYANGVSGAPGVATQDHVSNFTVRDLDSLVVNLVTGEVANQTGQKVDNGGAQTLQQVATPVVVNTVASAARPAASPTLLDKVATWVQNAAVQLFSWSSAFWLLLLTVLIYFANRSPQRRLLAGRRKGQSNDLEKQDATDMQADLAETEGGHEATLFSGVEPQSQLTVPLRSLGRAVIRVKVRG